MITEDQTKMLEALAQGLSTPPRLPVLRTPEEYGLDFEEVSFSTADGVDVSAWFMPAKGSNKIVLSNHFSPGNKYGFAGHLEGLDFAGGFEVNFLPRYKALVEAGYNILAYDLRMHGGSTDGAGISGVGYYEWNEVLAALSYVRTREDTKDMDISIYSMCMGANATMNAMEKHPEAFEGVKSMIAVAPLKGRTTIEKNVARMGIDESEGVDAFEPIYNKITGLTVEDHNVIPKAAGITVPTFFVQVRDDMNSNWKDVQEMYDLTPTDDKKIHYIEGTPWRFQGYNFFSDHPEQMIKWFDAHSEGKN